MKRTKHIYGEMQQQGFDIDCKGGLYLDYPSTLSILYTDKGSFYKANIDGEPITEDQLIEVLGLKFTGNEFANKIYEYINNNPYKYIYDICEKDLS